MITSDQEKIQALESQVAALRKALEQGRDEFGTLIGICREQRRALWEADMNSARVHDQREVAVELACRAFEHVSCDMLGTFDTALSTTRPPSTTIPSDVEAALTKAAVTEAALLAWAKIVRAFRDGDRGAFAGSIAADAADTTLLEYVEANLAPKEKL